MLNVDQHIQYFTQIWLDCPAGFPKFQKGYSPADQKERENRFELLQNKFKKLKKPAPTEQDYKDTAQSFFPLFREFLEQVFDFEHKHLDTILSDDFRHVSGSFFEQARKFGPELTVEDIYQGLRNLWIMNGLQLIIGVPVKITPPMFAYSMIYPYSDNFLDDPNVSINEKIAFSERFFRRLTGEDIVAENFCESQLYKLVEMIEAYFPRKDYHDVYHSLYAIHQAQTNSLQLLDNVELTDADRRAIAFEKGGTSVLADGFLVAGQLTQEQQKVLFGYGIYLQLLDDIQDLKEDAASDTDTLFTSICKDKRQLLVNKTVHFGQQVVSEFDCFPFCYANDFAGLILHSVEVMLIESVGLSDGWYSVDYIDKMNEYSPLGYTFIKKKSKSKSQRLQLFKKYFETNRVGLKI
ncbi:MAG: hypothetical protein CSA36_01645 [Draconibacterium sp.]|nr:MAG: hypothetical protein CSA36_01645 [Draconibacterium sp.]